MNTVVSLENANRAERPHRTHITERPVFNLMNVVGFSLCCAGFISEEV